jgi:hypothetical protein
MTLMEALLASVVLSIGASTIILPFTTAARNEEVDGRRTLAAHLGQEMMEEILSKPFEDPQGSGGLGPESGETSRSLYDNIDDYHKYQDGYNQLISDIVGLDGQAVDNPAVADLSRHVVVAYIHVSGQDTSEDPNFVRIEVTLKYVGTAFLTLTRLVYQPQ